MLINIHTQQKMSEEQFRIAHPNTSFPELLADQNVSPFGFAILHYPTLTAPQENYKFVADGVETIDGQWFVKYVQVPMTDEEIQLRDENLNETDQS
jgi:hypothetical protein